jgi:hypothetical protein
MPSKGKNKGNSGERHIAEFLTKTFGEKFNQRNICQAVAAIRLTCID